MPIDKQKTYRYMILDKYLRNHHHKYTKDELKKVCNKELERKGYKHVSSRTICNDIADLQLSPYNARFKKTREGHTIAYRYDDSFPGIELFDFSDEERDRINEAINVLGRFDGIPQYDWMRFCLQQIVSDDFMNDNRTIISFQNNQDYRGTEHLQPLLKAIADKHPLKIVYHPYAVLNNGKIEIRESETYNIHPYHLKQYNSRWFLIAQAESQPYVGCYPLDRIVSITPLYKKFIETDIDFSEYFENVIGVSVIENVIRVRLKINKIRYPYILSKPLNGSQKEIHELETDSHVVIELDVCFNKELVSTILSFGDDIEVLEPKELRNKIAKKIANLNTKYKVKSKRENKLHS